MIPIAEDGMKIKNDINGQCRRILILGNCGSGKSTLARQIGKIINLPVIHLDQHFWQPGWTKPDLDSWRTKVSNIVKEKSWIIDGNYGSSFDLRLPRADLIIFLDFHPLYCLYNVFRRRLKSHGKTRPDMAPGCAEQVDWAFIKWILSYNRNFRVAKLLAIKKAGCTNKLITLQSRKDVDEFLAKLSRL